MLLALAPAMPLIGGTRAAPVPTPSLLTLALAGGDGVTGRPPASSPSTSVDARRWSDPKLERPPPPGDLRTKSERMVEPAATMGLLMMLPNDEVERPSLRASSPAPSGPPPAPALRWAARRRLRRMKVMKAAARTSRAAPMDAPAMTAVGVPAGAGAADWVGEVSAPELAPLFWPGVVVAVGEEVGMIWMLLLLPVGRDVVVAGRLELVEPTAVLDVLAGNVWIGTTF